jgi:cobyrinic acid a,c-diamide synthase
MPPPTLPRLLVSGMKKSSGKTLLVLGLATAFRESGKRVRLYKKGPDYIDPMWHKAASGQDSYNLDTYLMGAPACRETFLEHSQPFDLSLIEGNHGLHDGMDLEGAHSSAGLAKLLRAPVLLTLDSTGMNRNLAAIVFGLQRFDPDVAVKGVVLGRVRSERQAHKQISAIEHHCGIPVVGCLPRLAESPLLERQLGLITPQEQGRARETLGKLGNLIRENVSLEQVWDLALRAPPLARRAPRRQGAPPHDVTLGVAYDAAFCFYYRENLEALEQAGARLVYFNTLHDPQLPPVDGLYIGGGFPESFLKELEANRSLRQDIAARIEDGLPAYAECGGMMYLARAFIGSGPPARMCGVLPADVRLRGRPVGYGYVNLAPKAEPNWLDVRREIRGHEFHYSELVNLGADLRFLYDVKRGIGIEGGQDGIVYKHLLASYTHIHARTVPEWAPRFVAAMRERRAATQGRAAR